MYSSVLWEQHKVLIGSDVARRQIGVKYELVGDDFVFGRFDCADPKETSREGK